MPKRHTTLNGIARNGIKVQKVTPPAKNRPPGDGLSRPPSQASRSTDTGTGSSKPASSQASAQAASAAAKAARLRRSRSSVGANQAASRACARACQTRGAARPRHNRHQPSS